MSHVYFSAIVPIKSTENQIRVAVINNTDGYNGEREETNADTVAGMGVRILRGCYTYEEAKELLNSNDDFYWGYYIKAIPFCNPCNKKTEDLTRRISETEKKTQAYIAAHRVANQKAAFIGCPECKSKIARFYFEDAKKSNLYRTDYCPVCRASMLSDTSKKTLKSYEDKIKSLNKELQTEKKRLCEKPTHYLAMAGVHN